MTTAIGRGRRGPVARAVAASLDAARAAGVLSPFHELTGVLALKVAAVVDNTSRDGDAKGMLSAVRDLRDLLDTLPLRPARTPVGGEPRDGADNEPAELRLLSGPPTMGDTAHT